MSQRLVKKGNQVIRPMKMDLYRLTPNETTILYYRLHPIEAIRDLLNIELNWYQRISIRKMWTIPFVIMCFGRAGSKTFLSAVISVLTGMLYPLKKILVLGPSKRQGDLIFDEIEQIFIKSEFFQASVSRRITKAPQESKVVFSNGSTIKSIPIGPEGRKIRGYRAHLMILDEFAQFDKGVIDMVIRPFMGAKRKGEQNRLIISSSAYYKWNHFWDQYQRYRKLETIDPKTYCVLEYDYRDVLLDPNSPFEIDKRIVNEAKENMTESDFKMEWMRFFPAGDTNYFSTYLIDKCTPREPSNTPVTIEKKSSNEKGATYIAAIDSAREAGGSNFALGIGKIINGKLQLVKMITLNGETYQKQISVIHQALLDFPVELLLIDKGGGGSTLKDLLTEPWKSINGLVAPTYGSGGKDMLPILDRDDPDHQDKEGIQLIQMINFHGSTHSTLFTNLKAEMEHGRIEFPIDLRRSKDSELEILGQNLIALKKELAVMEAVPKGAYLHFKVPNNFRSDRACVLALLNEAFLQLTKSIPTKKKEPVEMAVGFFVT